MNDPYEIKLQKDIIHRHDESIESWCKSKHTLITNKKVHKLNQKQEVKNCFSKEA